mmetsp:Transcript_31250/g.57282  ORF Transcript_31250/g.57282 Transcript_31250/m.57282 type:complete len:556 (+) Transcript_31250:73-1740(+)
MTQITSILAVACLVVTGSQGVRLVRSADNVHGVKSFMEKTQLSIRAWTFNAGAGYGPNEKVEIDHANMVNKLFEDNVKDDIIATCTLEDYPKKELHELVSRDKGDEWALIAYGKHSGFAGIGKNAQILSVFLRKKNYEVWYQSTSKGGIEKEWFVGYGQTYAIPKPIMRSSETRLPNHDLVVSASTRFHQTSKSGKGGVSALLNFSANGQMPATTISVICAHLDASDEEKRRHGLMQILEENARQKEFTKEERKRPARPSCELWDADSPDCQGKEYEAVAKKPIDAVLLFGDLNYRLRNDTASSKDLATLVSTPNGRLKMSQKDKLKTRIPSDMNDALLVRDKEQGGLAFKCNQPYEEVLPSYKRNTDHMEACTTISKAIEKGNMNLAEGLAQLCFTHKGGQWVQKNGDFQLGWLDRFCVRSVSHSGVSLEFGEQRSWDADQSYSTLSDHTPQEVVVKIAHPQMVKLAHPQMCPVPSLPKRASVVHFAPNADFDSPDLFDLHAGSDRVLAGTQLTYHCDTSCTMEGNATLTCGENGQFDQEVPRCVCDDLAFAAL